MHWHAEETMRLEVRTGPDSWMRLVKLTLRGYEESDGYERRVPFSAVAQADLFVEERRVFLHAAMTRAGAPLARHEWKDLGAMLKERYDVRTVIADRHGRARRFDALLPG